MVVARTPGLAESGHPADVKAEVPVRSELPSGARQTLGRNLSALTSGQAITWVMTGVYTAVVPRVIGPDQMGILTAAWATAGLFGAILGLGTKNYLSREIAARPLEAGGLLGTGMFARVVTIPVFFAAAIVYAAVTHLSREQAYVLYLATLAISITFPTDALQAYFQGMERMKYLAYGDVLSKTAQAAAGVAVAVVGLGAAGVSIGAAGAFALVLCLSMIWASAGGSISYRPELPRLKEIAGGSLKYWVLGLFLVIYLWIDTVMLSRMAPADVVAWYGAATRLFQALMFVPTIIVTAWLPKMVVASEDSVRSLHTTSRGPTAWVLLLGPPVAIGTAMTAGPVVHLIFGPAYSGAVTPLIVLACSVPLVYLNTVMANVFVAAKRPLVWSWVMVAASTINPLLNFALIRHFQTRSHNGAIGAAISLLLTELIITVVGVLVIGRKLIDRELLRRMMRIVLGGAAMWGAMEATRGWPFIVRGLAGVAVYAACAFAMGIVPVREMQDVSGIRAGLLRRSRHHRPLHRRGSGK